VAVLSIRRYLNEYSTESTNPLLPVCTLLLEGIARHALAFDREEYQEFRTALQKLASALETTKNGDELLAIAEAGCEAMARYNRDAQRVQGAQTVELRCMIEMLSQTLVALAEAGGQSVQALQSIQKQVEGARQLDDIRLLRARLGDSLKSISEEARRQRERNAEMLRQAKEAARIASDNPREAEVDRVSGLPTFQKAEHEIAARVGADSCYYAAVFVVERVESVNLRYGPATGDRLLQVFSQQLVSRLSPKDEVFRWRGPAYVALLNRTDSADGVRAEVARFASERHEQSLEVDGRPIRIPLGCAWTILPLAKCEIAGEACRQIDRFLGRCARPAESETERLESVLPTGQSVEGVRGARRTR
jgi:GGDEF domain-containing protein